MCDKINVIHEKSEQLRRFKYLTFYKDEDKENRQKMCDQQVVDIQSLCREIANDTNKYNG